MVVAAPALLLVAAPVGARTLAFHAALAGNSGLTRTGSTATGTASIRVDTRRERVSVVLDVRGITTGQLWDKLVDKPAGPIHFHEYPPTGGDAVLVLPLPYGPNYHATPAGFRVVMKNYDYAAGAKILGSTQSFADFVAALRRGKVVLNIHTDRFEGGEISGTVVAG